MPRTLIEFDAAADLEQTHAAFQYQWSVALDGLYDEENGDELDPEMDAEVIYRHPDYGWLTIYEGELQLCLHIAKLHNAAFSSTPDQT